jgi:carbon monoxide dehydrogenase subunit G
MSIAVKVELGYEFEVKARASEVFAVLADVPTSASFYPKVEQLVDLGDGAYRWEMEKIGIGSLHLRTVYTSRYVSDAKAGSVVWSPVQGDGNALVSGSWKIKGQKKSTHVTLSVQGEISIPLPTVMQVVVTPLVEAEFEKMTEQYIDNLIERFGGEV